MLKTLLPQNIEKVDYKCWFCNDKVENGVGLCYICRAQKCPQSFGDKKGLSRRIIYKTEISK